MPLEKKYVIAAARAESKDITVLEILDESSIPEKGYVKTAVLRLGTEEYEALGEPAVRKKLKITIEVEKPSS